MTLLLDTNLVVRTMGYSHLVGPRAREAIDNAQVIFVSSVSLWEIAIKVMRGKLDFDLDSLPAKLQAARVRPLSVTWAHAQSVRLLPPIHADPFDRMLVAQAMAEPLRLLTTDRLLARYSDLVTVV